MLMAAHVTKDSRPMPIGMAWSRLARASTADRNYRAGVLSLSNSVVPHNLVVSELQ